jgi:hypothetical protein
MKNKQNLKAVQKQIIVDSFAGVITLENGFDYKKYFYDYFEKKTS